MGSLEDLSMMLDEASIKTIQVAGLTKEERAYFAGLGVDLTQTSFKVKVVGNKTVPVTKEEEAAQEAPVGPPPSSKLESPAEVKIKEEPVENIPEPEPERVIPTEDIEEYLRTILSLKPYSRTYNIFGGQITAIFKTRTTDQNIALAVYARMLMREYGINSVNIVNINIAGIRLILTLEKLVIAGKEIDLGTPNAASYEAVKTAMDKFVSGFPNGIYSGLLQALDDFDNLVIAMDRKVNDQSFWQASGSSR